jgi:ADP-ribose pyrophosphatase YjhB (NUDIX family)
MKLRELGIHHMARTDYYHVSNSPTATSLVVAVSAVVAAADDKLLLHRRRDNNFWSLVGGKMEPGESIIDAVRREVREESSLDIEVQRLVGLYSDPKHVIAYSDGEVRQQFSICFASRALNGQLQASDESFEVGFYSQGQILQMNLHPAQLVRLHDYWQNLTTPFIR